jgi:hypothetical protein
MQPGQASGRRLASEPDQGPSAPVPTSRPGPRPSSSPPSPRSSNRTVLGALAFVIVLIGAGLVFAAMGPPTGRPAPSSSTAARASSTAPGPTLPPTPGPTAPAPTAAPTITIPAADAALLALISDAVHARADCAAIAPTSDFAAALSTVVCRFRSGTITGITVRLFDDTSTAQAAYDGWQDALRDHGAACADDSFEGPWSSDGREGRLLCYTADGSAYLFWTDAQLPVVGVAWRTDGYLKGLYGWWLERYPLAT